MKTAQTMAKGDLFTRSEAQQTLTGVNSPNKRVRCEWKRDQLFAEGEARGGDWRRRELGNERRALVKGKTVERWTIITKKNPSLALKDHRREREHKNDFAMI